MFDVYKVLTVNEWKNALNSGYIETILDKEDGFVHLSTSKQLALTLNLYFEQEDSLILLEINKEKLETSLVYEVADGNRAGEFPHLYDKLSTEVVSKKWDIARSGFRIPDEILHQIEKGT